MKQNASSWGKEIEVRNIACGGLLSSSVEALLQKMSTELQVINVEIKIAKNY